MLLVIWILEEVQPARPIWHNIWHTRMKSPALCFLVSILLFVRGNHAGWRHRGRQLQQAALSINPLEPVSASTADLVNDPTGLGHLLVRNTDFCSNSFCQLLRSRQGIRRVVPCENLPKTALDCNAGSLVSRRGLPGRLWVPFIPARTLQCSFLR